MGGQVGFGVQAAPKSKDSWLDVARRAEDLGFDFLCVGDHPGGWPSPFTALGAAAAVTSSIRLGTYVANAGLRDPLTLATDVATLDIVSDGRAVLGLGAGHTPQEWGMQARTRPAPGARVDRLVAVADAAMALLAGESVTTSGSVDLSDAFLGERLVRPEVPLLVGGNNKRLLRYAAETAQIVSLTGLGKTLDGGHLHQARWTESELNQTFDLVRNSRARNGDLALQALVQWAEVTEKPDSVALQISRDLQVDVDDVYSSPFVLIGSAVEIAEQVIRNRETWGIDSYVVRERSIDAMSEVMRILATT